MAKKRSSGKKSLVKKLDFFNKGTKPKIAKHKSHKLRIKKSELKSELKTIKKLSTKEKAKKDFPDSYHIQSDDMQIQIEIVGKQGSTRLYHVNLPVLGPATKALLEEIKVDLISKVKITSSEILDLKESEHIKERFKESAKQILKERLPNLDAKVSGIITSLLLQDMLGLGPIEIILNDENIEEIVVTSASENIRIYHKRFGWLETNIKPQTESQIQNNANIIARRVGRQITTLSPLLDAHLLSGDRANAVLFPVSSKGHTITIRKFARDPWTVTDLIKNQTATAEIFSLLWLCIQYEMSIIISGGTASGKTSFLNVCMSFIPPNHRIVSIEDTRELQLPEFLYWCPLTTREPNTEGKGKITMLDLLINSLRMRPDRIVLGETRTKEQAEVLFEGLHTGHSVYSTIHANSVAETIRRLISAPIEVPPNLLTGVNLNVVMFRDRRKGIRRIYQVGEFVEAEAELVSVKPNIIYRWKADTDEIVVYNPPSKLFDDLSLHTGMTLREIREDIEEKKEILDWLVKNNMRTVKEVGETIRDYYLDKDELLKKIRNRK